MEIFSQRLKEAREKKEISHATLASLIGAKSRQQVAGWEAGGQPRDIEMIPKICRELDVTADWLFGLDQPERPTMSGLTPRHIDAARNIAALPRAVQETVFDLIDAMRPLKRDGLISRILSYDTRTASHERLMRDIEDAQRHYREERTK